MTRARPPIESRDTVARVSGADEDETIRRVDDLIETLPEADDPYWVAIEVMGAASEALVTSRTAVHQYRLWAALTDRYELRPNERREAVADMRRAALEWLEVKDDPDARARYFETWLYDVLGYERD